jgi:hypothetical protein
MDWDCTLFAQNWKHRFDFPGMLMELADAKSKISIPPRARIQGADFMVSLERPIQTHKLKGQSPRNHQRLKHSCHSGNL